MNDSRRSNPLSAEYIAVLISTVGAYLFFMGWTYGNSYYYYYGLGLNQVETDVTSILAWTPDLIQERVISLLFFPIAIFSLPTIWNKRALSQLVRSAIWMFYIVIVLSFVLWYMPNIVRNVAISDAACDSDKDNTRLHRIQILLKTPDGENAKPFSKRLDVFGVDDNGSYLYIGRHKGIYYLLSPSDPYGTTPSNLIIVPDDIIGSAKILEKTGDRSSCT